MKYFHITRFKIPASCRDFICNQGSRLSLYLSIHFLILVFACRENPTKDTIVLNQAKLKEDIIAVNKPAVVMETDEINAYIKAHGYAMKTTGSGLRFMYLKENAGGEKIINGMEITLIFKVWLLDGTLCYDSEVSGKKKFIVGADHLETGIHEAVQLMHKGEKAMVILPSHLAFGLIGDRKKIPPKSAVVYSLEIEN